MDPNHPISIKWPAKISIRPIKKGFFHAILNRLRQQRSGLVSFYELRHNLPVKNQRDIGMQVIEIDKIIGSLNRYQDFDDSFLPRQKHNPRPLGKHRQGIPERGISASCGSLQGRRILFRDRRQSSRICCQGERSTIYRCTCH